LCTSTEEPAGITGCVGTIARMRVKTGLGSQLDEQTGGRHAGAKGLVVDPNAGAHDVALFVVLLCSQKS